MRAEDRVARNQERASAERLLLDRSGKGTYPLFDTVMEQIPPDFIIEICYSHAMGVHTRFTNCPLCCLGMP